MAATTTGSVSVECKTTLYQRTTLNDKSNIVDNCTIDPKTSAAYGTAVDQCDVTWHDLRTVAAGATDSLDLTNLPQQAQGGATIYKNFARVKVIQIDYQNGVSGDKLVLDGSATNAYLGPFNGVATAQIAIGPGNPDGQFVTSNLRDGFGLTTATNKILSIKNPGANAITYAIGLAGTSA